jgi:hypothetical protein
MTRDELLDQHGTLSAELSDLLLDRAEVQSAVERVRAETFEREYANSTNITTIREMAGAHAAKFASEGIKLTGQIDSLRVQLGHLELRLQVV